VAARSLFLDDHGALFGLYDGVGCGLGLLPACVVFGLAFAVIDMPNVVSQTRIRGRLSGMCAPL
jgi:hypothetical protein